MAASAQAFALCSVQRRADTETILSAVQKSVEDNLAALQHKLGLPAYKEKTPQEVQAQDQEKLAKARGELATVQQLAETMQSLLQG